MALKLRNSDDATTFVHNPVQETETDLDFGADPFDIIARIEAEQGYPMATRIESIELIQKSKV